MENLENMLFEAATHGDVNSLNKLLQEDPIILDKVLVNSFGDTPVHIAVILGHIDFVREIVKRRPEFAQELNLHRSSPLHLAAAKGYTEIVAVLLLVNPQMGFARDKDGLAPVHLAAIKGRIDVLKGLIRANPNVARLTVDGGQTILHLCVKYYRLEALMHLMENIRAREFINSKDNDGNTILHLAVTDKQVETVKFLLKTSIMDVNARNLSGMTPMDILVRNRKDARDEEIEESLYRAGAAVSMQNNTSIHNDQNVATRRSNSSPKVKQDADWLEKIQNSLMVVAILIATMAFQAGVNPPGGVWQETKSEDSQSQGKSASNHITHYAGKSIFAHEDLTNYQIFLISNTTGFMASLSIILLLMSGLPLKNKFFVWIMLVITWIAISAVALTYVLAIWSVTPEEPEETQTPPTIIKLIGATLLIWLCLMVLLFIAHTIRLVRKIVRKFIRLFRNPSPTITLGTR